MGKLTFGLLFVAVALQAPQMGGASANLARQLVAQTLQQDSALLLEQVPVNTTAGGGLISVEVSHNGGMLVRRHDIALESQENDSNVVEEDSKLIDFAGTRTTAGVLEAGFVSSGPAQNLTLPAFNVTAVGGGDACIVARLREQLTSQWVACSTASLLGCGPCRAAPSEFGTISLMVVVVSVSVAMLMFFLAGLWLCSRGAPDSPVVACSIGASSGGGMPTLPLLELLRFFAAMHILENHFYFATNFSTTLAQATRINLTPWVLNFAEWGTTWVSFFFMLSGFMHMYTSSSAGNNSQESESIQNQNQSRLSVFMARSLTSLRWLRRAYPVHVLGLLIAVYFGAPGGYIICSTKRNCRFAWQALSADMLLMDVWVPGQWIGSWLNTPTWFLSALLPLGMLFHLCCTPIRKLTTRGCGITFFVCFAVSGVPFIMQSLMEIDIFNISDEGSLRVRNFSMQHPLSHWPAYVAGMAAAQFHMQLGSSVVPPWLSMTLTRTFEMGAVLLMLVFIFAAPWSVYVWVVTGLLMPFHLCLLLGFAKMSAAMPQIGVNRFSRLETTAKVLGRLALPVYLLQVPVIYGFNVRCGERCSRLPQPLCPCIQLGTLFTVCFIVSRGLEMMIAKRGTSAKGALAVPE